MSEPRSEREHEHEHPRQHDHELLAFARRLRARHVRGAVQDAVLRAVLTLAVPIVAAAWLLPDARWALAGGTAVLAALTALGAFWRARRVADAALLRTSGALDTELPPPVLAELGDELATWLEGRRAAPTPMRTWLARDVHGKLPALPAGFVAQLGKRRLGRLAWLVPLLVLLLFAWWIADLLSPPWPGVLGGRAAAPDLSTGDGGGGRGNGGDGGEGAGEPQPDDQAPPRQPDSQRREAAPPPPPPPAAAAEPPQPEAPAPLLELPGQQHFVVPEFIGDGPTRRARMRAAELEEGPPAANAPTPRPGEAPKNDVPPPAREQFERAAEAALAARHVPPAEQPMVRRYFDALQKAAK